MKHQALLTCDRRHCLMQERIYGETVEACEEAAYETGWRTHRGKTLCPMCAARTGRNLGRVRVR